MSFSKLSAAKFVVSGVVGIGTGKIVGKIIKAHVTPETIIDKVTTTAAAWVIAAIATERTKKYTDDVIDDIANQATLVIDKFKTSEKLARVNRGESTIEKEGLDPTKFRQGSDGRWVRAEIIDSEVSQEEDN